jgi:hypothetical protein
MTSIIHDFKSIRQKLERQEQKAEYEANNPKEEQGAYGYLYGTPVPLGKTDYSELFERVKEYCDANPIAPLKSQAHPEWPYAGTPFEWSKFVKVKI